jgi:steroid delta-isomerase-like uncharacterized protein
MTRDETLNVLARRREALVHRAPLAYEEIYAPHAVLDSPLGRSATGPAAIKAATFGFLEAFPHAVISEGDPMIDGSRATTVADVSGSHERTFMGLPPSGRPFRFTMVAVFDFEDGKIARERRVYDFTGFLLQIGVLKAKPVEPS